MLHKVLAVLNRRTRVAGKNSWQGLKDAFANEEAFKVQSILCLILIPLALVIAENYLQLLLLFCSNAPKPIGKSKRGSNFLLIARYRSNRPTSNIMDWPRVILKIPRVEKNSIKLINSQPQKVVLQIEPCPHL